MAQSHLQLAALAAANAEEDEKEDEDVDHMVVEINIHHVSYPLPNSNQ